jgi:hypothetical protein
VARRSNGVPGRDDGCARLGAPDGSFFCAQSAPPSRCGTRWCVFRGAALPERLGTAPSCSDGANGAPNPVRRQAPVAWAAPFAAGAVKARLAKRAYPQAGRECVSDTGRPAWRSARASAFPPVESCRGTSPIQAAKSRPDRKTDGSAISRRDRGGSDDADARYCLEPLARLIQAMLGDDPLLDQSDHRLHSL